MIERFEKHGERGRPEGTVEVPCTEGTAAQVERLVGLGATVATRQEWVVLRVPGGHAACIVPALEPSAPASVPASDRG